MNKFLSLISSNGNTTLQRRAASLSTQAEIAQQNLVNNLKQELSMLELEITNLTDLAPNSKDSLRPGSKDWNPVDWATKLQEAKTKHWQVGIQLQIAVATYNEYFVDAEAVNSEAPAKTDE